MVRRETQHQRRIEHHIGNTGRLPQNNNVWSYGHATGSLTVCDGDISGTYLRNKVRRGNDMAVRANNVVHAVVDHDSAPRMGGRAAG
jgi:hypothetical protein